MRLAMLAVCSTLVWADNVPWVDCEPNFTGSKTVRTPDAKSRKGRNRAWAELTVERRPGSECANTARLFVNGHMVFEIRPSGKNGNASSIGVVGWSPDGRRLAAQRLWTNWGSDFADWTVLIYDAKTGETADADITTQIENAKSQPCSLLLRDVPGWTDSGRLRLRVSDWYEQGNDKPAAHCATDTEEWLYDPVARHVQQADAVPAAPSSPPRQH